MNDPLQNETSAGTPASPAPRAAIRLFGIGTAGLSVLDFVAAAPLPGVETIAVGMDPQALSSASASVKLLLAPAGGRSSAGGGDPQRGRVAAEEHFAELKQACKGAQVVFIAAGLGGAAGTGISPVLARAARETGALAIAFVTLPFECEGNRRRQHAAEGLDHLKAAADGVICLSNERIFKVIDENTTILDTFKVADQLLAEGITGLWRLVAHRGLLQIHFADVCALLRHRHETAFASVEAAGPTRSREVLDKLLGHALFDGGKMLADADAVVVSVMGGPDLAMAEINRVMEHINGKCEHALVIMGAAVDPAFGDRLAVTLVAARGGEAPGSAAGAAEVEPREAAPSAGESDSQFLSTKAAPRSHSRFVPPPPALSADKVEQIITRQGLGRPRKATSKLRQTTLPLEIVSKGRFEKSEPTIHKGQDLDMPTYIRRGMPLN